MAEKKPSGFRFRLPWLLQPALPRAREPPRTTIQTSVASTPAQRPPFRPPRKAPTPPPTSPAAASPTVATQEPFSPRRSPPQSVASPPPPSTAPKSPTAKTIEPVAPRPAKETQTTTETIQTIVTADSTTAPLSPPPFVSPKSLVPNSPTAKTAEPVAAQPAKETQTTTETIQMIVTADPTTPPLSPPPSVSLPTSPTAKTTESVAAQPAEGTQTTTETTQTIETANPESPTISPPLSPLKQAQSQPSPPKTPLPLPVSPKSSVPESPTAKTTEPVAPHPATETKPTNETAGPPMQAQSHPSPLPATQSPTRTPSRSPPRLAFEPTDAKSTSEISETKKSTMDSDYIPQGNHLALDEKPREMTETVSMDSHSMDTKSQIKDNFVHQIANKESMDEKPASVIIIAGDNTGALMNLGLDSIRGGLMLTTDHHVTTNNGEDSENQEPKAIINSNIQGINNSIMFESSVTESNPGVHLGFYRNLGNIDDSMVKNTESIEMLRVEANITPPQKLVYNAAMGSPGSVFTEPGECEFKGDDPPQTSGKSYEIEVL